MLGFIGFLNQVFTNLFNQKRNVLGYTFDASTEIEKQKLCTPVRREATGTKFRAHLTLRGIQFLLDTCEHSLVKRLIEDILLSISTWEGCYVTLNHDLSLTLIADQVDIPQLVVEINELVSHKKTSTGQGFQGALIAGMEEIRVTVNPEFYSADEQTVDFAASNLGTAELTITAEAHTYDEPTAELYVDDITEAL